MKYFRPINDYALIGDCRAAALISRAAEIEWLCWPRFDSPSFFASLLDPDKGGSWKITPLNTAPSKRRYITETNILETFFESEQNSVSVTDFMPAVSERDKKHFFLPANEIIRIVTGIKGETQVEVIFNPRSPYGKSKLKFKESTALGIRAETDGGLLLLRSEVPLTLLEGTAGAIFKIKPGQRISFSLSLSGPYPAVIPALGKRCLSLYELSKNWWRGWAGKCLYRGPYRDQVIRSALVLKLFSFAPSGAIVASATASLPERIGGSLNWDYRYCWLRDASMTTQALISLGYMEEAESFVNWLLHATTLTRPEVKVLYDVYGRTPPAERKINYLSGYMNSKPVRISNSAKQQFQLDIYGEVIDSVFRLHENRRGLDRQSQAMIKDLVEYVTGNWQKADAGIWESRGPMAHYTHSKLLCWAALDRLLKFKEKGDLQIKNPERYENARREIRQAIENKGWNKNLGSFVSVIFSRGFSEKVDASLLLLPWYGFIPYSSPKMRATYDRIRRTLGAGSALFYRNQDYKEGAFGVCSLWACIYLASGGGSFREAQNLLDNFLSCGSDLHLFAEEIEPETKQQLGNFPLAFTHLGIINATLALENRRRQEKL